MIHILYDSYSLGFVIVLLHVATAAICLVILNLLGFV